MSYSLSKAVGLFLGPILFAFTIAINPFGFQLIENQIVAIAFWMISWWISECIDLGVTSLLPIILFPLLGFMPLQETTSFYGSHIIFLFMGGFFMAIAMEKANLHKRIALTIVKITGTKSTRIVFGFMVATAFLSMWISNTATTVMMLPIVLSVIQLIQNENSTIPEKDLKNFGIVMTLAIAYSANIGGIATIIGTPPNTVLSSFAASSLKIDLAFGKWFLMAFPLSTVILVISYFVLLKIFPCSIPENNSSKLLIENELRKLGKITLKEKLTLSIFLTTAFLWITRSYLNKIMPGLKLNDSSIAIMGSILLFTVPISLREGDFILNWNDTKGKMPWNILLLFGGGLALAGGMSHAGIIEKIALVIASFNFSHPFILIILISTISLFMTEVMSNVALAAVIIPVVSGMAQGMNSNPLEFIIPVTLATSFAFMLPMSTPPNAIVFASGHIKIKDMIKAGFFMNIISLIVTMIFSYFVIARVFPI